MNNKPEPKYISITHHLSKDVLTAEFLKNLRPQQLIELARVRPLSEEVCKELIKHFVSDIPKDTKYRTPQINALVHCLPEINVITAKIYREHQIALADPSQAHVAFFNMVSLFIQGIDVYHHMKIEGIKLELFTRYALFTDTLKSDLSKGIAPNELEQIDEVFRLSLDVSSHLLPSQKTRIRDLILLLNQRRADDIFYMLSKDVNFAYGILLKYAKAQNIHWESAIK